LAVIISTHRGSSSGLKDNGIQFIICADGVCRLNPEMARMVVAKVST